MSNSNTTMTTPDENVHDSQRAATVVEKIAPYKQRSSDSSDSSDLDRPSKFVDSATDALPPPPPTPIVNEAHDRELERFARKRQSFFFRLIYGG